MVKTDSEKYPAIFAEPLESKTPGFNFAVPKELGIPADPLRLRLDFHHQSTVMTYVQSEDVVTTKMVDAMDVAHALANDLNFSTGLLPLNTLWWGNTRNGTITAIYVEPKIWTLTLQEEIKNKPQRFTIPLPGFIFMCKPGIAPWVVAVKRRPTKETDTVYHAPLANIFRDGRSCPGSNKYPERPTDIVQSFWISFFSSTANLTNRSKKYPKNILSLWKDLDKKKKFPLDDLVEFGKVSDLMQFQVD